MRGTIIKSKITLGLALLVCITNLNLTTVKATEGTDKQLIGLTAEEIRFIEEKRAAEEETRKQSTNTGEENKIAIEKKELEEETRKQSTNTVEENKAAIKKKELAEETEKQSTNTVEENKAAAEARATEAAKKAIIDPKIYLRYRNKNQTLFDENKKQLNLINYLGSTYLPARAMANLYNKDISWEFDNTALVISDREGYIETTRMFALDDGYEYLSKRLIRSQSIEFSSLKTVADLTIYSKNYNYLFFEGLAFFCGKYITYDIQQQFSFTRIEGESKLNFKVFAEQDVQIYLRDGLKPETYVSMHKVKAKTLTDVKIDIKEITNPQILFLTNPDSKEDDTLVRVYDLAVK